MVVSLLCVVLLFTSFSLPVSVHAQIMSLSKEELIEYTKEWTGERFPDGRPRVPDYVLEEMKNVSIGDAWGACRGAGYNCQHETSSEWKCIHPDQVMVGRAVTAVYLPSRPVMEKASQERGEENGLHGGQFSWAIQQLVEGDVYIVDCYGKIVDSAPMGGNFAAAICGQTGGGGAIVNGSIRDAEELSKLPGFNAFAKDWEPSYARDMMLFGINIPARIGGTSVMPGDIVLAKNDDIVFIPPHVAVNLVKRAKMSRLENQWANQALVDKKYKMLEIHGAGPWADNVKRDFAQWLRENKDNMPEYGEAIEEYLKRQK